MNKKEKDLNKIQIDENIIKDDIDEIKKDENNEQNDMREKSDSSNIKEKVIELPKDLILNEEDENELTKNLYDKKLEKVDTKLYTKTFAETKENYNNSSINNQLTDKTEFLEMLSKQKETDREALDNIIINEANRIKIYLNSSHST